MPIVFNCPECQKQLRIQDGMGGKKVRCPHCKAIAVAPAEEEPIVATPVDEDEAVTSEAPPPMPRAERRERRRDRDDDDDDDRDDYDSRGSRRDRPRRRRDHDDFEDDLDTPRGMPTSVVLAIIALCIMLGLELVMATMALAVANLPPDQLGKMLGQTAIGMVVGGLILWGLIAGHRLAWQWGRILGMLGAILTGIGGIVAIAAGQPGDPAPLRFVMALVFLTISTCLFIITFSLGTRSARSYFRLRCPSCGRFTSSAADFFFNMAKCKRCKEVW